MEKLQKKYHEDVAFLFVYTREAHPDDGAGGRNIPGNKIKINGHTNYAERVDAAKKLRKAGKEAWRVVVDDMKSTVQKTWGGLPNSAFLINPQGKIAHKWSWVRSSTSDTASGSDQDTLSAYKVLDAEKSIKAVTVATDPQLYLRNMLEGWIKYSLTGTGSETVTWNIGEKENTATRAVGDKATDIKLEDAGIEESKTESKTLKLGKVELPCVVVKGSKDSKDETWYCGWLPGDSIAKIVKDGKVIREIKDAGFKTGESGLTEYDPSK